MTDNGRLFKVGDLGINNGLPDVFTVAKLFGSVTNAQQLVDSEIRSQRHQKDWTKEVALETLTNWVTQNGRMFQRWDLEEDNRLPSLVLVRKFFGSLEKARLAVDPEFELRRHEDDWTKETALEALKKWVAENGRMFKTVDLGPHNGLPTANWVIEKFLGPIIKDGKQ